MWVVARTESLALIAPVAGTSRGVMEQALNASLNRRLPVILTIAPQGAVRAIYTEWLDLAALGKPEIRRASHVEPGDDGWYAEIEGGPVFGPFPKRSQAIRAEVAWIDKHVM